MKKLVLGIFFLSLCVNAVFSQDSGDMPVVSGLLLKQGNLKLYWQNKLALKDSEKIQRMLVLGQMVYILTDENYFFAMDAEKGHFKFSRTIAPEKLPVYGPVLDKGLLYIIAANRLVVIDAKLGVNTFTQNLSFPVGMAASLNDMHIYLAGIDKRLRVMDKQAAAVSFAATADDDSFITALVAQDAAVIFGTDTGLIMSIKPEEPKKIWTFRAVDAISGITSQGTRLFVSSRDTNLYALDFDSGQELWKMHTGSALVAPPLATEKTVYQLAPNKGIYAVDAESGKNLWLMADGVSLMAESAGRAFVMTNQGRCAAMENKTGKRLFELNFGKVASFAANTADERLFISDAAGMVSCIGPAKK